MAVTNRPIDGKLVCNASPGLDSGLIGLLERVASLLIQDSQVEDFVIP
jgi:hypothetical protein